ncbi:TonB-dependent receptor [Adhaeribacter radiodurans]|uniref:TonB-dependent receptor n=1 Tax=Adhaeribacter radiodurans TaxID=2745197 RepID=A0A7L7LBH0_9BACT|nr:TonB-dependent receptor [Adhaeribacter radiodurans]QMU29895.1 TonB-dependent receptor [Adhaeribacter radiodurans]
MKRTIKNYFFTLLRSSSAYRSQGILFFWVTLLSLFFRSEVYAQGTLKGYIRDSNGKGLAYVSTGLLNAPDSKLVKGTLTNEEGAYEFLEVPSGQYVITANMVGYASGTSATFKVDQGLTTIPILTLNSIAINLKEVAVTTKRPFVEQKIDRMVVNVANSIISSGSTALEVLEKAPGITVDRQNDNLQLRGKEGVIVQIDGRQTYLAMAEVVALLRTMPSDNIDRIELITNPSAKYDAAGNSGIIDIRLKKNTDVGTNGSVSLGAGSGRYDREQGSVQLNHRTPKLNLFGNYSANRGGGYADFDLQRIQKDGLQRNIIKEDSYIKFKNRGQNAKAGLDYTISKNTIIGLIWTGLWSYNHEESPAKVSFRRQENEPYYLQTLTDKTISNVSSNQSANLNLQHTFGEEGGQLTADFDLGHFVRDYTNSLNTETLITESSISEPSGLYTQMPTAIDIHTFKVDYNRSFGSKWKVEAGIKGSSVRSDNDLTLYSGEAGNFHLDSTLSNHFRYTERIKAAYASISGKLAANTDIQVGLRTEQTHSEGNSITLKNVVKRDYLDFFPSVFLSRTLSAKHTLTLSYSYRIDRPNYQNLNPGRSYLNPYAYSRGNAFLQPQYTNSLELKHGFDNKVFTSLGASYIHDLVVYILQPVSGTTMERVPENIGKSQAYNLTLSLPITVRKGWTLQTTLMALYSQFQYTYLDMPLQVKQISGRINGSNAITLGNGWTAEVTGWINTPAVDALFRYPWLGSVDAGLQKGFGSKWKAKLSVQDLLHTNQILGKLRTDNYSQDFQIRLDTRVAMLNLTYAFGNQQLKESRRRKTSAEEEMHRTN